MSDPLQTHRYWRGTTMTTNSPGSGISAGGSVSQSGKIVGGRDVFLYEGFRIRSKMRRSAKNCIRLGIALLVAGIGCIGAFVIAWNVALQDTISTTPDDLTVESSPDLPSPTPWLPMGASLAFVGIALIVVGLCLPRDRYLTATEDR
jgi:hypothetical protein